MKKRFSYVVVTFFLFVGFNSVLAFDKLVVFGDSLSDLGFQDNLGPVIHKAPLWTTPGGQTWPFYLSHALHLSTITVNNSVSINSQNQFVSGLGEGDDYAAGGATTTGVGIGSSTYQPPSIQEQINRYWGEQKNRAADRNLYVVWGGANDLFIALKASDKTNATLLAAKKAADNIDTDAAFLIEHGARHVVILGLPDLGNTPFALAQSEAGLPDLLTKASDLFNTELRLNLPPGAIIFDVALLFNEILSTKQAKIGDKTVTFDNVSDSKCSYSAQEGIQSINALTCIPKVESNNKEYLFTDGIHPTDLAHQVLGAKLAEFVNAQSHAN
jgi:phospholipase/lecithinase/hemolysin